MSDAQLARYKENPVSTDTKAKMSESAKHRKTQPKRTNIQKNNAKARLSLIADAYKVYKENGGEANWNEFQKLYKDIYLIFFYPYQTYSFLFLIYLNSLNFL